MERHMLRKIKLNINLLCLLSLLTAQEIIYNQEFPINSYTPSVQMAPSITSLSDGKLCICWNSYLQDGSKYGIYGQLYTETVEKLGDEFQVNIYTTENQINPNVIGLSNGTFFVCWVSFCGDPFYMDIFGQLFNSSCERIGQEFRVNTYTKEDQLDPCVSGLDDGNFIVCWTNIGSGADIYGQVFDATCSRIGQEFQVNTYTDNEQYGPRISALSNDKFIICWSSDQQDGSKFGIYGQIFNGAGDKQSQEFQVNTYTIDHQWGPSIATFVDGKFIICWSSNGQDGSGFGVYGQLFNAEGDRIGQEFQVNTYTENDQEYPCITCFDDGKFIVCWSSNGQDGSGYGIYGQLFNAEGDRIGQEFQMNTYTENDQYDPSIICLVEEKLVVCWVSYGQDGDKNGIFGKYYLADPIEHILRPFQLRKPQNDEYINTLIPSFYWQAVSDVRKNFPWELTYDLYIATSDDFTDTILFEALQDTVFIISKGNLSPGMTYYWKVLARNIQGDSLWSSTTNGFYVSPDATATGIEDAAQTSPIDFILEQNYPNPFNPTTTIPIVLAEQSRVTVKVYNIMGQVVATLARDQAYSAGRQLFVFDGNGLAGGIYFVEVNIITISGEKCRYGKKMLMVK